MADYSKYIRRISVPDPHAYAATGSREIHDFDLYDDDNDDDDDDDDNDSATHTFGKVVRRMASAQRDALNRYLRLHNESDEERDHGWLRDLGPNILEAMHKGRRTLQRAMRDDDETDD